MEPFIPICNKKLTCHFLLESCGSVSIYATGPLPMLTINEINDQLNNPITKTQSD